MYFLNALFQIVSLMETPGGIKMELDSLEESVYDWQVKVHKHHLAIIGEEERLLRMHIKALKQEQLGMKLDAQ